MGIYDYYQRILSKHTLVLFVMVPVLWINGCSNDSASGPLSIPEPDVIIRSDTPLVAEVLVSTETRSKISLDIISNNTNVGGRTIDFENYATTHSLPIYDLKPASIYNVTIHTIGPTGVETTLDKTLTFGTSPLPDGFPRITTVSEPTSMEPGYTLFNVMTQDPSRQPLGAMLVIVDNTGEVVWYHRGERFDDFRMLPNGHLIFLEGWRIVEMDMLGNRIHEWEKITDPGDNNPEFKAVDKFHHELYPMPNGNYLVLGLEERDLPDYPVDMNNYPVAGESGTELARVVGDVIVEFDPSYSSAKRFNTPGQLVQKWHLLDMLDPYRLSYSSLGGHWNGSFPHIKDTRPTRDWSHANAVIYDDTDDSIIVSVRHQDAVVKFSRETIGLTASDDIKWILAPKKNWDPDSKVAKKLLEPVTTGQVELPKHFYPYHQHAPMVLLNGNILLYDNGNYRLSPPDAIAEPIDQVETFSRAVEYHIDEQNMTAELVWQYGPDAKDDPAWNFSGALGDADLLPETGNVLITHGSMAVSYYDDSTGNFLYEKYRARVVEVTHTTPGKEVFNMLVEDGDATKGVGWRVYRSERLAEYMQ